MKYFLTIILFAFISVNVQAKDCELVPNKTFCGVALDSTKNEFFKVVGNPSSEIKISGDKVGYIYVNNNASIVTMLIFTNNILNEIRTWETNPNIDFWHHLPQVEVVIIKTKGLSFVANPRRKIKELGVYFSEGDGDQFSENFIYLGSGIKTFYAPFYGPSSFAGTDLNAYEDYTCQSATYTNFNVKP